MNPRISARLTLPFAFAASFLLASCGGDSEEGTINETTLKEDISAAAAIDKEVFAKITESDGGDLSGLESNMSLTAHWMFAQSVKPEPGAAEAKTDITMAATAVADPADLMSAVTGGSRVPALVSVIRPEYITQLAVNEAGAEIKGTVTFEAKNGLYKGTVRFWGVADKEASSGWTITGFRLPKENVELTRENKDSPWKRSPAPASE